MVCGRVIRRTAVQQKVFTPRQLDQALLYCRPSLGWKADVHLCGPTHGHAFHMSCMSLLPALKCHETLMACQGGGFQPSDDTWHMIRSTMNEILHEAYEEDLVRPPFFAFWNGTVRNPETPLKTRHKRFFA